MDESLADYLRFPVFVQSLTPSGMDDLKKLRRSLPASTSAFLERFDADLDPEVRDDQRFDYRLHLIPQTGPKTEADLAVNFVRLEDLIRLWRVEELLGGWQCCDQGEPVAELV